MSKTNKDTYKKEREPRTYRRKVEEERVREVVIPSRTQLDPRDFVLDEDDNKENN